MRHWHFGLLLLAAGCNKAGYEAVAIRPTFGWDDGCAVVTITGHGFGESISATVGGAELTEIQRPDDEEERTFSFTGIVAASDSTGAKDVVVTSDDVDSTIPAAYYYVACPDPMTVDVVSPDAGVAAGAAISVGGCNIDPATMQIRLYDPRGVVADAIASLTSDCGEAYASFTAPAMPDGTYWVIVEDIATGVWVNPASGDPRVCNEDTAADCDRPFVITYGGGE